MPELPATESMDRTRAQPRSRRSFLAELVSIPVVLLGLSLLIRQFDLDLRCASLFFRPDLQPHWWASHRQLWDAIYDSATIPALVVGVVSLLGLLASLFRSVLKRYRRTLSFLLLVLLLGPGLLVNMLGKDHAGRPRPRQIIEFGGSETFLQVGERGVPGRGKSFPSGHASMGFYFLAFYILWRGRRDRAARTFLVVGCAAGAIVGFQRIASGAHFLSDVLWAGGAVYISALLVDRAMPGEARVGNRGRTVRRLVLAFLVLGVLGLAFLATPYNRVTEHELGVASAGTFLQLFSVMPGRPAQLVEEQTLWFDRELVVRTEVRGYGTFESYSRESVAIDKRGDSVRVEVTFLPHGFFTRLLTDVSECAGGGRRDIDLIPERRHRSK